MAPWENLSTYIGLNRIKKTPWMANSPDYQPVDNEDSSYPLDSPHKERSRDGHAVLPAPYPMARKSSKTWIIPWIISFILLCIIIVILPKTISYHKIAYPHLPPPPETAAIETPDPEALVQEKPRPRKAVILATTAGQKTGWHERIPQGWEIYHYVVDDENAALTVPRNQGREAMVYLTYIIDHYDDLPEHIVFTHGQEKAWHQPEPLPFVLEALNLPYVTATQYVNLRCTLRPSCEPVKNYVNTTHTPPGSFWRAYMIRNLHKYAFRPDDPWYDDSWPESYGIRLPPQFASPCCAQFAVHRDAVLQKPFAFWDRLRELLLRDIDEFKDEWWPGVKEEDTGQFVGVNEWNIGNAFERMWHYFFGLDPVTCPDEEHCRKVVFQDKIACNGTTSIWIESQNFPFIKCNMTY